MFTSVALALCLVGMTPEEEVEAWQPFTEVPSDPADVKAPEGETTTAVTRATTVLAPVAAVLVGTFVGFGSFYAISSVAGFIPGSVAATAGFVAAIAAFDATLALALHAFLPPLPSWTIPTALVAATVAGAAGLALSGAASLAYVRVAYAGSDCYCGADLLLLPVTIFATTTLAASTATTLVVISAENE